MAVRGQGQRRTAGKGFGPEIITRRRLRPTQTTLASRGRTSLVLLPVGGGQSRGTRYNRGDKGPTSGGATNRASISNLRVERATPLCERTVAVPAAKE